MSSSTLRSDTQAVTVDLAPSHVFAFIADPENLPLWAVGFCRAIRRDTAPDQWIVTTAQGDVPIRYVTSEAAGTIDFHFTPAPGVELAAFSRVTPNAEGSEYIFTQFQPMGMSDEAFDAQVRALSGELRVLQGLLLARAACPA